MNEIWKPIFEQIISLIDRYADNGSSASFIEENSIKYIISDNFKKNG